MACDLCGAKLSLDGGKHPVYAGNVYALMELARESHWMLDEDAAQVWCLSCVIAPMREKAVAK